MLINPFLADFDWY